MIAEKKVTVLYVDDEETNLYLFKCQFDGDYMIRTASSGMEGLKELEVNSDDIIIVISDMRMPNMNGLEFIKKAKEKYDRIFYFILTGYEYSPEIDEALKTNLIQRFFSKPFQKEKIMKAISELVDGNI